MTFTDVFDMGLDDLLEQWLEDDLYRAVVPDQQQYIPSYALGF